MFPRGWKLFQGAAHNPTISIMQMIFVFNFVSPPHYFFPSTDFFFFCRLPNSTLVFTAKFVECFSLSHLLQMTLKYELLPKLAGLVRASLVKRMLTE